MSLTLDQLGMRFGGKILFQKVSLQLNPGHRYGLVGANGAGKTTLLRILMDEVEADQGGVRHPKDLRIGCLQQDQFLYDEARIVDVVVMGNERLWEAMERKEVLLGKKELSDADGNELAELESIISHEDGYSAEGRAGRLLQGLGIPADRHTLPMRTLSGGYRLRVLLAQLFFSEPDVLLLDEPTNHLDIFSILWLGEYLQGYRGLIVVISHHRDFLNTVCTDILDLDYGTLNVYKGNYDAFEQQKMDAALQKEAELEKHEKRKDDLQGFVDRFRYKASKARQAQSRVRMIEKLEREMGGIDLQPSSRRAPHLGFQAYRPSGAVVLKVDRLCKSYGEAEVLRDVSIEVERGEKLAIIGPNGIGKSTLLEILTENVKPNKGAFDWGHAVRVGYFAQDPRREAVGRMSLIDWLAGQVADVTTEAIRGMLGACLFSGDDALKPVDALSGGEVARLILAKLMLEKPNVLVFDEPTNHLDMEAIEELICALQDFDGTVLTVSHNTYFLSQIATRVVELNRDGVQDYKMGFDEYRTLRALDHSEDVTAQLTRLEAAPQEDAETGGKQSYEERKRQRNQQKQLQRELERLEKKSESIEAEIEALDLEMASPGFFRDLPVSKQSAVQSKKAKLEEDLQRTLAEWERIGQQVWAAD